MHEDSYADLPEGATVEPYEEGDFIGDRITFDAVPVEEVGGVLDSGESGAFTITHQDDSYVFKGSFDLSGQAGAGGVSDAEMKGFFAVYGKPEMKVSRSEEHTSELQSLMRISYDAFCLKKNNKQ